MGETHGAEEALSWGEGNSKTSSIGQDHSWWSEWSHDSHEHSRA